MKALVPLTLSLLFLAGAAWAQAPKTYAAFPTADTRDRKFWPAVARVESAYGDRNLVCSCLPVEGYA